jgi:hypothetical protein
MAKWSWQRLAASKRMAAETARDEMQETYWSLNPDQPD